MKISYSWLKDYVQTNWSAEEIADKLTFSGLEIEGLNKTETVPGGLEGVVVGEVIKCENLPDSDHLHITEVNIGEDKPLQIVCGAPNVVKGQKVPVATVGTVLYFTDPPLKIKRGKLRGVVSEGMICAEDELCLGNSHDGIMVLDENAKVGTPLKQYLNINDEYVFEIGLTANRSDGMGHIGVARDLAALQSLENFRNGKKEFNKVIIPDLSSFKVDDNSFPIDIKIEDPEACLRYAGVTISGVKVDESPKWLKEKLMSIGLKPINNIVDISNFVLFETGHPLHTFDADKIKGNKVIIKKLPKGSKLVTLDDIERELTGDDLIICNESEGMVIAGVLGGVESGINDDTENVFIESAVFDPTTIRKTAKHFGLQTDASFRYERGVNPEMTIYALKRAALLIQEIAGGKISSEIVDIYPNKIERKQIKVSFERLNKLVGKVIEPEIVLFILQSMDMDIVEQNDKEFVVAVPGDKYDVVREADIIEEVLRIYGYNNVEDSDLHIFSIDKDRGTDTEEVKNKISNFLTSNGFNEIMNNSLISNEVTKLVSKFDEANNVKVINSLSKELDVLRRDLIFGGLQTISYNINRKNKDLKLYEFGEIYIKNSNATDSDNVRNRFTEETHLSILLTGHYTNESWYKKSEEVTFFDLKSVVLRVLVDAGLDLTNKTEEVVDDIFGQTLIIKLNKKEVAKLSAVPNNMLKYFDIDQNVFYADIFWENVLNLAKNKKVEFTSVPKFPAVRRDLALLVDKSVTFEDIVALTKQRGGKLIQEINLFDVYEGKNLAENKKSYAVSFILCDDKKTLTDDRIDKVMENLIKQFANNLGATLR